MDRRFPMEFSKLWHMYLGSSDPHCSRVAKQLGYDSIKQNVQLSELFGGMVMRSYALIHIRPQASLRLLPVVDRVMARSFLFVVLIGIGSIVLGQEPGKQAASLRVARTDATLTVLSGERPILVYNLESPRAPEGIDKIYERSGFLHPVYTPDGEVLTAAFPVDHPHQHGIFSAWVKTKYDGKDVDFWNLAGRTAYVAHERVESVFQDGTRAGFVVQLLHRLRSDPPVDVLREEWKLTVQPTDGTYFCFDLETTQKALTDKPLVVEKYHYGGMAFRGPVDWLLPGDEARKRVPALSGEGPAFLNSLGNDRIAGNHAHARWVALSGTLRGRPGGIIILDHADNFRAPQAARLHPTKPYFCLAPCVDGEFVIDKNHPYRARYRFLATGKAPDPAWLDAQWAAWVQP